MKPFPKPAFRGGGRFKRPIAPPDAHRINEYITAREVRVIAPDGEQLGVLAIQDALQRAQELELDLVEVAPGAAPPVCKILDYGKFKYREQKKEAEAKKNRTETTLKELRLRYSTDVGDFENKLKQAREFLEEGCKVKVVVRFRGREVMYVELGRDKLKQFAERLADVAVVDEKPGSFATGKQIHIGLAPKK